MRKKRLKRKFYPIDRISLLLIFILSLVIGLLIWSQKSCGTNCFLHVGPKVSYFSWQDKQIGAEDTAFILTFDRPMDRRSVEENLALDPPLPGKISWAGRRIAYTLNAPAPYGIKYRVKLEQATARLTGENEPVEVIEPFVGKFSTRDRAFAYIGSQGERQGRLTLYNLTRKKKTIITPPNLVVLDFKPYPKGDRILFSAADRSSATEELQDLKLYSVTTGINHNSSGKLAANKVELVLDNKNYQNNDFQLSQDGHIIVVRRVNRNNPEEFDLWMLKDKGKPQPLNVRGGEFLITPDSQTLAIAKGEGIALLPLKPGANPLDFLPKFGRVLSFSRDGRAAAMVNYNTDNAKLKYTRSLFYVNNQGIQKELLNVEGSILDCQFDSDATHLYCLLTQLLEGDEYRERPYLAEIDLKTSAVLPIIAWPNYQDIQISIAPDGLGILFDQVITADTSTDPQTLRTSSGEAIVGGRLWLLIKSVGNSSQSNKPQLEELPLIGFHPQWLP